MRGKESCMLTGSLYESSSLVPCCGFHTALRPPPLACGAKLHRKGMCQAYKLTFHQAFNVSKGVKDKRIPTRVLFYPLQGVHMCIEDFTDLLKLKNNTSPSQSSSHNGS